ncbi:MAG: prolipoprotein diacylglyceryl transferase [Acidobacteria bacterium]|jgi:phosphatidylglycerol:prolipoprotein diacylglycerol transferase|nr:MAG: prolipoprotein diacylglyceryl transferase [Acidobacteriota bacterium]GIU81220.1 MAG: prolipoprotein diacylglyceryl transferase [Pyrinomonadaceae bacterium]
MYPELIRIGNFPIHTYGVLLAVGILLALFVAARLASKDGLPRERIYDLGLWTVIGGLLGSKILMIFVDENFSRDFSSIFSLDFLRSGGVYYGGFIGGVLTLIFLIQLYKLSFWKVADAFAPAVALGQAVGRQGCFAAGCCWGKATNLPWGVHFGEKAHEYTGVPIYGPDGSDLYLHPTQLYESFAMLLVFLFLLWLHRRKKFDGQILIAYAILYPIVRFTIEFFRDDPRGDLFGLTTLTGLSTSQIISLIVALVAIAFMIIKIKSSEAR